MTFGPTGFCETDIEFPSKILVNSGVKTAIQGGKKEEKIRVINDTGTVNDVRKLHCLQNHSAGLKSLIFQRGTVD